MHSIVFNYVFNDLFIYFNIDLIVTKLSFHTFHQKYE